MATAGAYSGRRPMNEFNAVSKDEMTQVDGGFSLGDLLKKLVDNIFKPKPKPGDIKPIMH
jgi:hypothetical protein